MFTHSKHKVLFLWVLVLLLLLGLSAHWYKRYRNNNQTACTLEAKICPDGSSVGREGPQCEFAACPDDTSNTSSYKTWTDSVSGISFKYPETFGTTYMHELDWPPKVQVVDGPFTCTQAGSEVERAGITETVRINNKTYCVTKVSEGAAGSMYTQYAYAKAIGTKVAILTFTVRAVQCGNYNDPEKTKCDTERNSFQIDSLVDRIFSTLTI